MAVNPGAVLSSASTAMGLEVVDIVDIEGKIAARCSFLHDVPHGSMAAFNADGELTMEGAYQFG